jgi:hypothetical protein
LAFAHFENIRFFRPVRQWVIGVYIGHWDATGAILAPKLLSPAWAGFKTGLTGQCRDALGHQPVTTAHGID